VFKANAFLRVGPILAVLSLSTLLLRAQSPELPPGAMQHKVTTSCTECHDARIILQQRLSATAWGKEVDKMIRWGAMVDPADRATFIEYLRVNFPPDKAPEVMPRALEAKRR
jgi:hypothetical protein